MSTTEKKLFRNELIDSVMVGNAAIRHEGPLHREDTKHFNPLCFNNGYTVRVLRK